MFKKFSFNYLSVDGQCYVLNGALALLSDLVDCFKYLNAAISAGKVSLIVDELLWQRNLIADTNILSTIDNLPKTDSTTEDIKRLWFIFMKNKAKSAIGEVHQDVSVSAKDGTLSVTADIRDDCLNNDVCWISLSGREIWQSKTLQIEFQDSNSYELRNAYNLQTLKDLLPQYEPNPKHKAEPYYDRNRNEHVSAMPLDVQQAQELLLLSVPDGDDLVVYCDKSKRYFRYKLTYPDRIVYHGFQIEEKEIASNVLALLK